MTVNIYNISITIVVLSRYIFFLKFKDWRSSSFVLNLRYYAHRKVSLIAVKWRLLFFLGGGEKAAAL